MIGHLPQATRLLRWRTLRWIVAATVVPISLWACTSHPLEKPNPTPETQTDLLYEVNPLRQLDLIFMVDDSNSMKEEQANLRNNFPDFMTELQKIDGGLPDLHIAVISSSFGAGPTEPDANCHLYGDRGRFLVKSGCGLQANSATDPHFLSIDDKGMQNFTGQLPDVFSCMANLGTDGCGYEHQLQSLRAALAQECDATGKNCKPFNAENAGFLRPDAYLGIILLSDEDDCSGDPGATIYKDQVNGQSGSLRCATLGHVCDGMQPPSDQNFSAPIGSCKPYVQKDKKAEQLTRLIDVQDFIDFVKNTKGYRQDKILVSGVIGWDDKGTYKIGKNPLNEWDLLPICSQATTGSAAPGLRLKTFIESFDNNSVNVICKADLKEAMAGIGKKLANLLANTCITEPLIDTDATKAGVQADCQVVDREPSSNGFVDKPLPNCSSGKMPCWDLQEDLTCGSRYKTIVKRGSTTPPPNTLQSIKCLTTTK